MPHPAHLPAVAQQRLQCPTADAPTLPPLCSGPVITPQPTGPHSVDIVVAPPNVGTPFVTYDIDLCLADPPKTCIPTKTCNADANPTASATCTISFPDCAETATDCLRANTNYTAVAIGVRGDGIESLDSNVPSFSTNNHE